MNLCLDIGNSKIRAGVFSGRRLAAGDVLYYHKNFGTQDIKGFLERLIAGHSIEKTGLISVFPPLTIMVLKALKMIKKNRPKIIAFSDFESIGIRYRTPEKLGMDRLINAYAAYRLYDGPTVVVDIGTAVTWDAVNAKGQFLGGAIAPGPGTMAKALRANTALLPLVNISGKPGIIGRDTKGCIQSGLYWGTAGMVKELVKRISLKFRGETKIIITGGLGKMFQPLVKGSRFDEHLTLQGINMLLEETE